jgi:hypothetical protein
MNKTTHAPSARRLRQPRKEPRYSSPEVTTQVSTVPKPQKPARLSRRQLGPVLALLRRVASGGDATTAVDAAALVPIVERGLAAAPPGQPRWRCWYSVLDANGYASKVHGLAAAAKAAGKARSTVANALSKGNGAAEFPATDEHGNPAIVLVNRVA